MSEAANDKYRDVISLTENKKTISNMYTKIAKAEEKRKTLGNDIMLKNTNLIEGKSFI